MAPGARAKRDGSWKLNRATRESRGVRRYVVLRGPTRELRKKRKPDKYQWIDVDQSPDATHACERGISDQDTNPARDSGAL